MQNSMPLPKAAALVAAKRQELAVRAASTGSSVNDLLKLAAATDETLRTALNVMIQASKDRLVGSKAANAGVGGDASTATGPIVSSTDSPETTSNQGTNPAETTAGRASYRHTGRFGSLGTARHPTSDMPSGAVSHKPSFMHMHERIAQLQEQHFRETKPIKHVEEPKEPSGSRNTIMIPYNEPASSDGSSGLASKPPVAPVLQLPSTAVSTVYGESGSESALSDAASDTDVRKVDSPPPRPRAKQRPVEVSNNFVSLNMHSSAAMRANKRRTKAILRKNAKTDVVIGQADLIDMPDIDTTKSEEAYADVAIGDVEAATMLDAIFARKDDVVSGGNTVSNPAPRPLKADPLEVCMSALEEATKSKLSNTTSKASSSNKSEAARVDVAKCVRTSLVSTGTYMAVSGSGRPLCSGHRMEAVLRRVKKGGPNKGRYFYACPCEKVLQCGFFLWKDEDAKQAAEEFLRCLHSANNGGSGGDGDDAGAEDGVLSRVRRTALKRWNPRDVTVKALRAELQRRQIGVVSGGKKSVWWNNAAVVGEVLRASQLLCKKKKQNSKEASAAPPPAKKARVTHIVDEQAKEHDSDADSSDSDDDSSSSSSSDESETENNTKEEEEITTPTTVLRLNKLKRHELVALLVHDDVEQVKKAREASETTAAGVELQAFSAETNEMLANTLRKWYGFSDFRGPNVSVCAKTLQACGEGCSNSAAVVTSMQAWAIQRCLAGLSTVVVAATGAGKSLLYQLPAELLRRGVFIPDHSEVRCKKGITVVISPLLALIQDQIRSLPPDITAVALTSGETTAESISDALYLITQRQAAVLFVSPERLLAPSFQKLARNKTVFPPVELLCIDEAHVLTEWSHNFRPAYLRLPRLAKQLFNPRCAIALTATATPAVVSDLKHVLACIDGNARGADGVETFVAGANRENLRHITIRVADADRKHETLLHAVKMVYKLSVPSAAVKPGIDAKMFPCTLIYVSTQHEADTTAKILESLLPRSIIAVYHAGLSSDTRKAVHRGFLENRVRVCVCTVAFGMGIDKPDVRAVVHMQAPRSVEEYIQQAGRAGRDGEQAYAITVISGGADTRQKSAGLCFSDWVDPVTLAAFVRALDAITQDIIASDEVAHAVSDTVIIPTHQIACTLNLKAEVVDTLLHQLESLQLPSFPQLETVCARNRTVHISICQPEWDLSKMWSNRCGMPPLLAAAKTAAARLTPPKDDLVALFVRASGGIGKDSKGRPGLRCDLDALLYVCRDVNSRHDFPYGAFSDKPDLDDVVVGISSVLRQLFELQADGKIMLRFIPESMGVECKISPAEMPADTAVKDAVARIAAAQDRRIASTLQKYWDCYTILESAAIDDEMLEKETDIPTIAAAADTALQTQLDDYFRRTTSATAPIERLQFNDESMAELISDAVVTVRRMIEVISARKTTETSCAAAELRDSEKACVYFHPALTNYAVARVLAGLTTPMFPYREFSPSLLPARNSALWGKYAAYDFAKLAQLCRVPLQLECRKEDRY